MKQLKRNTKHDVLVIGGARDKETIKFRRDLSTHLNDKVEHIGEPKHTPLYLNQIAHAIQANAMRGKEVFGIFIGDTPHEAAMYANKTAPLVRAAVCLDLQETILYRQCVHINLLCLPKRFSNEKELAYEIIHAFLTTVEEPKEHKSSRIVPRLGRI